MRWVVLIGAFLLVAPAAEACVRLPAPHHTPVKLERGVLRVCTDGRTLELARGVAKASAAGHRVAWIYQRRGKELVATVKLARVGRRVVVLRRFTALRENGPKRADMDIVLFRPNELAWLASGWDEGKVSLYRTGRPVRTLYDGSAYSLVLEDGRTLAVSTGSHFAFFDLRHRRCPSRSRFAEAVRSAEAIVTRADYQGGEVTVVRGCDTGTGRDRELAQIYSDGHETVGVEVVGLDRRWALLRSWSRDDRYDESRETLTAADVVTGRSRSAPLLDSSRKAPPFPAPTAAAGFVVADGGTAAWVVAGVLYAMVARGKVVVLDRGAITGLRADGERVVWRRDDRSRAYIPD